MSYSFKVITLLLVLFTVIVGTGIYSYQTLNISSEKLQNHISEIEESIKTNNWDKASNDISSIQEYWAGTKKKWTVMLDHFEIDNIDTALSRLASYVYSKDAPLAMGEVSTLKQYVKHIPEKESFKLSNIF